MSNNFAVSTLVSQTMTEFFLQKSPILNTANREYVESFSQQEYMTGGTINIKVPGYPAVQTGLSVSATGIQDLIVPFTITQDNLYNVTRSINLLEQLFDIRGGAGALTKQQKQAIVDNYAYPAYMSIEGAIELNAANQLNTFSYLTPIDGIEKLGSINSYSAISNVTAMMDLLKFSPMDRVMMMNVLDSKAVADSLQNMFNEVINKNITMNARVGGPDKGHLAGLDMYQSPELQTHIAGPLAGTPGITVSSVSANGLQVTLTGVPNVTSQLINAGDMISVPSVNLVAPITFATLPYRLVLTAVTAANGDGAGNVVVTLPYPLMASGEHQNVASLPSNGAPVDVYPNYNQNYAYVKSGLSAVPLKLGDIFGAANSDVKGDNRCPVKVVIQGAVASFTNIFRISVLVGIQAFSQYTITVPSRA